MWLGARVVADVEAGEEARLVAAMEVGERAKAV